MTLASTASDPPARRRRVAGIAAAAALLLFLTGCGLSPAGSSGPEPVQHMIVEQLEVLPGVNSAQAERSPATGLVDLDVMLSPGATSEQISEIGVQASAFPETEFDPGSYPGTIELRMGEHIYSYFSLAGEQALRDQLSYWHHLAGTGLSAVSVRTYTPPLPSGLGTGQSSEEDTGAGEFTFSNSQLGRFVSITLPNGTTGQDTTALFQAVRAVPDPGAASGEWAVLGVTAASRAHFVSAHFPSSEDLRLFTDITGIFEGLGAPGTLQLELDQNASPQVTLDVVAFDSALDRVPYGRAEEVFQSTATWQQLKRSVVHLDGTGLDFKVSIMSNPLEDASNFRLEFSVINCSFLPDERWTRLSEELSASWTQARKPGSTSGACAGRG